MTIQQAYKQLLVTLYEVYDNREAANIADVLLEHITGQRKIDRVMYKDLPVDNEQQQRLTAAAEQLLLHKPLQYVINKAWFAGHEFYVNEAVLVPRPETEELVAWILDDYKNAMLPCASQGSCTIIDIGTGSGCIPISLKKALRTASVTAVDVSADAIGVAMKNAATLNCSIDFKAMNFLDEAGWVQLETYDIIVSNPPYIKQSEDAGMRKNVLDFEPHLALFVPDEDALVFYKALAAFGKKHLNPAGTIYMEINEALGQDVVDLFKQEGYEAVELRKDMQGKDRMIKASCK